MLFHACVSRSRAVAPEADTPEGNTSGEGLTSKDGREANGLSPAAKALNRLISPCRFQASPHKPAPLRRGKESQTPGAESISFYWNSPLRSSRHHVSPPFP